MNGGHELIVPVNISVISVSQFLGKTHVNIRIVISVLFYLEFAYTFTLYWSIHYFYITNSGRYERGTLKKKFVVKNIILENSRFHFYINQIVIYCWHNDVIAAILCNKIQLYTIFLSTTQILFIATKISFSVILILFKWSDLLHFCGNKNSSIELLADFT